MRNISRLVAVTAVMSACVSGAQAVEIQTVTVGNPGNADDTHGDGYGGVDYVYNIGTFEVTAGQYTEFLNAVAATDMYGLYSTNMWTNSYGCKIERTGSSPNYSYTVGAEWADRPVNYVSWGDAARFANWLYNGQPTGAQDLSTTEDGSYYLNGATNDEDLMAAVREPDATWVIPSEDEWYKAAYHYNDGVTDNYWDYPTRSDNVPACECCPPAVPNSANYDCNGADPGGFACGPPFYGTNVGCYDSSASPYGTFDQGGNVWEWNESVIGSFRGVRGGSFGTNVDGLHVAGRSYNDPADENSIAGFRIAEAPGPIPTLSEWGLVAMALLVLTAGTLVWARRRAATA